ncbi:MAG TPA: 4-alpha-glucanotransferase [Verrucomicrobiota bacterium]|nr:4-alpha-glucanotransferase [Verrucomicrobiota bacterium]HNT16246.1 4-alpha-glucanotransferase [Verrucomicrobiota bacterium]
MKLSVEQSLAGILEPVFAIRTETDLGVGDTDGVRQMVDWCAQHGLHIFQTLPINETGDDHSPYNAISSLAIEPATLTVTPQAIPDLSATQFAALAPEARVARLRQGAVQYPAVKALKHELLGAAFAAFQTEQLARDTARARAFAAFSRDHAAWVADYALFRTLRELPGNPRHWEAWPRELRDPRSARAWLAALPNARRQALEQRQLYFTYVQWLAFSQWEQLRDYALQKRVGLMGDIPYGVGRNSADVWANGRLFDLDWNGGAPPETTFKTDPFIVKWGQNWGVPLYRWDVLRQQDFSWWRQRVSNVRRIFQLFRIDHVLGLFRIYAFPWTPDRNAEFLPLTATEAAARTGGRLPGFKAYPDDTAEHRARNQAQGEELLKMIQAAAGETVVIAEDLGLVPDYVAPTLQRLGIPGFRIPMLFRDPDWTYSDPKQYPRLSLAQPATHDHTPLAALWRQCWANVDAGHEREHNQWELRRIMRFGGLAHEEPPREFADRIHEGFLRAVMESNSWLAIFQIQDVFGQTARFNVPGSTSAANWSARMEATVKQFATDARLRGKGEMFSRLAQRAGRSGGVE